MDDIAEPPIEVSPDYTNDYISVWTLPAVPTEHSIRESMPLIKRFTQADKPLPPKLQKHLEAVITLGYGVKPSRKSKKIVSDNTKAGMVESAMLLAMFCNMTKIDACRAIYSSLKLTEDPKTLLDNMSREHFKMTHEEIYDLGTSYIKSFGLVDSAGLKSYLLD